MGLNGQFKLLHNLFRNFDPRGHHKEEKPIGLRVLAGLKPHYVAVVTVCVAHPADVTKPDGQEGLAGGGEDDSHMTVR